MVERSSPERLLMLISELGYGGAESSFLRLADYLAQRYQVTIVVFETKYRRGEYSDAVAATSLPIMVLGDSRHASAAPSSRLARWRRRLRELRFLKRRHDITISFLSGPNLLNALAGRRYPAIISERGSKIRHSNIGPFARAAWTKIIDPFVYRRVDRIVPVSHGYADEVRAIAGAGQENKIVAIEGGVSALGLVSKSDGLVDDDIRIFCENPTVVFCGRLDRGKGIDLLLPVFANVTLRKAYARLLVIGDGPLLPSLVDAANRLKLRVTMTGDPKAQVFLAGYRSEPLRHYRLCKAFLFCSEHEGLGNALIEAVAAGVPILSADCKYGPRSILSGRQETADLPDQVIQPHHLNYGTLMPLLSAEVGPALWGKEIGRLIDAESVRPSPESRFASVKRFDLDVTGPLWVQLIDDVLRERCIGRATRPA